MQLIRLGLDGFQYMLTGRCYCLGGGAAAPWISILTKFIYHRFGIFINKPGYLLPVGLFYVVSAVMLVVRARVDILIAVVIAIVELLWMGGGTVKYPKQNFHEK